LGSYPSIPLYDLHGQPLIAHLGIEHKSREKVRTTNPKRVRDLGQDTENDSVSRDAIAIDIIETKGGLIVLADVPSFQPETEEGITVHVDDERMLTIGIKRSLFFREYSQGTMEPSATRVTYPPGSPQGEIMFRKQERSGTLERKMVIPEGFEATIASKTISNGQLQLLPRTSKS